MKQLTPGRLARICGGEYFGTDSVRDVEIEEITIDSRTASKGCLFVAIKGERADGNAFLIQTFQKGAICCISEYDPKEAARICGLDASKMADALKKAAYIKVESSYKALKDIAEYYRVACGTKIIGITGSVGKTTTKEMIYSVLSERFVSLKTLGNFNNEVGVPLTIFRLREEHEAAVVEMGISGFGEMSELGRIVKPDVCVITNIGQCHLENLIDRDGVLKAKTEIFDYMRPGGKIYLNGDDDKLAGIGEVNGIKPVFFGTGKNCTVRAANIEEKGLDGVDFDAFFGKRKIRVHVPVPGAHMISNAICAAAIGMDMGMADDEIARGIEGFVPVDGHGSIIKRDGLTIFNDCYNANPSSMKAGIDLLADFDGRKVAIIGDMFELGQNEKLMHYNMGKYAAKKGIDCVACVGKLAREYEKGLVDAGSGARVLYFEDVKAAVDALDDFLKPGDGVLIKASHSMHFEKIIEEIGKNERNERS